MNQKCDIGFAKDPMPLALGDLYAVLCIRAIHVAEILGRLVRLAMAGPGNPGAVLWRVPSGATLEFLQHAAAPGKKDQGDFRDFYQIQCARHNSSGQRLPDRYPRGHFRPAAVDPGSGARALSRFPRPLRGHTS